MAGLRGLSSFVVSARLTPRRRTRASRRSEIIRAACLGWRKRTDVAGHQTSANSSVKYILHTSLPIHPAFRLQIALPRHRAWSRPETWEPVP